MKRSTPSRTAEAVCLFRALDQYTAPAERTLDDPFAALFLGPLARAALSASRVGRRASALLRNLEPGLVNFILARHRFIDDHLAQALSDPGFEQVVILGAGYDTRAYRFADALRGRPVFEVDYPSTGARKARLVRRHSAALPGSCVRRVEIDFQRQSLSDRLLDSGFAKGARTFFVWEGVSMYLSPEAIEETLQTVVGLSAAGSELSMDFWFDLDTGDLRAAAYRASARLLYVLGEPILFGLPPKRAPSFMAERGLEVLDLADAGLLERRYPQVGRVYRTTYLVHSRKVR